MGFVVTNLLQLLEVGNRILGLRPIQLLQAVKVVFVKMRPVDERLQHGPELTQAIIWLAAQVSKHRVNDRCARQCLVVTERADICLGAAVVAKKTDNVVLWPEQAENALPHGQLDVGWKTHRTVHARQREAQCKGRRLLATTIVSIDGSRTAPSHAGEPEFGLARKGQYSPGESHLIPVHPTFRLSPAC